MLTSIVKRIVMVGEAVLDNVLPLYRHASFSLRKSDHRVTFSLSQEITLGEPCLIDVSSRPDTNIHARKCFINVPVQGMIVLEDMKIGNVAVTATRSQDAVLFLNGFWMDLPTLTRSSRVRASMRYTGLVPSEFRAGDKYTLVVSFSGTEAVLS
jgi:hypothetical protein